MSVCPQCSAQVKDEAKFCFNCGSAIPSTLQSIPYQKPESSPYIPPSTPVPPGYSSPYIPPPSAPAPPTPLQSLTSDPPHWLVTGGSIVAIISSFLPWYSITFSTSLLTNVSNTVTITAWSAWPGIIAIISSILCLGLAIARILKIGLPPLRDILLYYIFAIASIIGALIYWISPQSGNQNQQFQQLFNMVGVQVSMGPGVGIFLCLVSSAAIIIGNYLNVQQKTH